MRVKCFILIILVVWPALVFAADQDADFTVSLEFQPTGDVLWDAFAGQVLDKAREAGMGEPGRGMESFLRNYLDFFDDDTLSNWEADFGADPRYWQLYYEIEDMQIDEKASAHAYQVAPGQWDSSEYVTTQFLYEAEHMQPLIDTMAGLPERGIVDPLCTIRSRASSEELCAAFPDEALLHYFYAQQLLRQGKLDAACERFQQGNKSKHNRYFEPFPASFVKHRLVTGEPLGNEFVAGIALLLSYSLNTGELFIDPLIDNPSRNVALSKNPQLINAYHQFLCRAAVMDGVDPSSVSADAVDSMFLLLEHTWANHGEELSEEQQQALNEYENKLDRARELARRIELDGFECAYFFTHKVGSSAWTGIVPMVFEHHVEFARINQEGLLSLYDIFGELAQFDFATISWQE